MRRLPIALLLACALLTSCRDKEVEVYTVAKEAASTAPSVPAHNHDHDHDHDHAGGQAEAEPAAELRWSVPKDWREQPASGMRLATFLIPSGGAKPVDLSVVVLSGDAGGELANVNRWRGQIGLEPMDEKSLAVRSERIKSVAGTLLYVDFTGEGSSGGKPRMLAAILPYNGKTWFFKATGLEKEVEQARPSYRRFLESLR